MSLSNYKKQKLPRFRGVALFNFLQFILHRWDGDRFHDIPIPSTFRGIINNTKNPDICYKNRLDKSGYFYYLEKNISSSSSNGFELTFGFSFLAGLIISGLDID